MKVTKEKLENSQVALKIEVEPQEKESYLEKAYRRMVGSIAVPGFRKGKAPRVILERHVGKEALLQEAMEQMLPEMYKKAVEEQGIDAIGEPEINMSSTEPIIFQATVPLKPTVELGDYKSIRIPLKPVAVTEEDINGYLESLRERNAVWQPVERAAQTGDRVTADVQGVAEGKSILDQKGLQFGLIENSPMISPGFTEKIVGMSSGEEKEFQLPFPPDYRVKDLAGKECLFKVKVNETKEKKLPELNDEFAKSLGEGLETLEALRARIGSDLQKSKEELNRREHEAEVLEAVASASKAEYPPVLVEKEIDRLVDERVRFSGRDSLEHYLEDVKKSSAEIRDELREQAQKRVVNTIVLDKVAEVEKVQVAEEDIDSEIQNIVKASGEQNAAVSQRLNTAAVRESFREILTQRKTLRLLSEIALSPEASAK